MKAQTWLRTAVICEKIAPNHPPPSYHHRPELKPVDKEVDVVLKFPEVEKLQPPILMLSTVAFHYEGQKADLFWNVDLSATME